MARGWRKPARALVKEGLVTGVRSRWAVRIESDLVHLAARTASGAGGLLGAEQRVEEWLGPEEGATGSVDAALCWPVWPFESTKTSMSPVGGL